MAEEKPKTTKPRRRPTKPSGKPPRRPKAAKPVEAPPPLVPTKPVSPHYRAAVGRRKEAVAYLRFTPTGEQQISVNGLPVDRYFPSFETQAIVRQPFTVTAWTAGGSFSLRAHGGGKRGQAEASRLAISRLLASVNPELRPALKRAGLLTRDPRVKERKKYGLKRARRAPQWQKR